MLMLPKGTEVMGERDMLQDRGRKASWSCGRGCRCGQKAFFGVHGKEWV